VGTFGSGFEPGVFLAILQKKYWGLEGAIFAVLLVFFEGVGEIVGVF
jgi:hypothetical protein